MLTIAYIYTVHYEIDLKKKLNSRTFILIIHYSESRQRVFLTRTRTVHPGVCTLKFENEHYS